MGLVCEMKKDSLFSVYKKKVKERKMSQFMEIKKLERNCEIIQE